MSRAIVIRPSAKINLTLHVGPKRADGFHDVRTLLQSVAIFDTVTVSPRPGPFRLLTRAPGVPTDKTNLMWRAAELLWRELGREGEPRDVHVKLDKQIPVAAGMGGGSADAAAVLIGLNEAWQAHRSPRDLAAIGAMLGSDVPFFFHGGTALGLGRGEELYLVEDAKRMGVVIIKPSFGVSTADAYGWLDADRAAGKDAGQQSAPRADLGWETGPVALVNDLQHPVAERHEAIGEMVAACVREGALASAMTGSGSVVFGLFPESTAPRAAERLARPDWLVTLTRTLGRREARRRIGL